MTKKKLYLIIRTDEYHSKVSQAFMGVAEKYEDAQKLYGQALKKKHKEEVIHIYESSSGILTMESMLDNSKKILSSDNN